jgi:uncharacterized protein (TIGR04255 family)
METSQILSETSASPAFERPPVVETALSVQFEELKQFTTVHFGLFYETIRDRFPEFEGQERLPPIVEAIPIQAKVRGIRLQAGPNVQRVWYRDAPEGAVLVQVQPDRFGFNWQKVDDEPSYPSYAKNSGMCLDEFQRFVQFAREHELGDVRPNFCEVVYVNHIRPEENESVIDLFRRVFAGIDLGHSDDWLPSPEVVAFNRTYVIGEQQGRLYVEAGIVSDRERGDLS